MKVELSEKELDIIGESLPLLKGSYWFSGDRSYVHEISDLQKKISEAELNPSSDAREGV